MSEGRAQIFARADALAPEFLARAAEGETNRTMPADLAAKVKNADVLTDIGQVALGRTPTAPNF
jgi:hypothetical protein